MMASYSAFGSWERRLEWPHVPANILDCHDCHEPFPEDQLNAYGYCAECRKEH